MGVGSGSGGVVIYILYIFYRVCYRVGVVVFYILEMGEILEGGWVWAGFKRA